MAKKICGIWEWMLNIKDGDCMSYSIIFETKIVKLSDGRLLHLDLSGCNNDNSGRSRDDWSGKIYTEEDFIKYAEGFMKDSKPSKECNGFDLKIRSKYSTYHDYGKYLLRMMKRAVTFEELRHSGKYISFNRVDGATVYEDEKEIEMTIEEFDSYYYKKLYNGGIRYRINYTLLETEEGIINALNSGKPVRIYISK